METQIPQMDQIILLAMVVMQPIRLRAAELGQLIPAAMLPRMVIMVTHTGAAVVLLLIGMEQIFLLGTVAAVGHLLKEYLILAI